MNQRQILTIIIVFFLLLPPSVSANSIYNRSPWPTAYQNLEVVKENTDFQDAAHLCNRTHGRSFNLTHSDSFKLSGLSVYVYLLNSQDGKFDRNLFRLSFLAPNLSPLASGISSTYSAPVGGDGGGLTTEVFFPINVNINGGVAYTAILECLTDEPDTFRVPESSRIDDGLTQYYDSTISQTSQTNPYYMSGRKILFTTFSERNAPHFPALSVRLPESTDKTPGVSSSPKYHPVIFVHGLGGDPQNFESDSENRNYVKLLTDLGYPKDYIHLYSYGYKYNSLKRINEYNYQGDVKEIAQGMEVVVNSLSDKNKAQGGDGKVDIVGHSLGTLVTRYYLKTHANDHKIRRFIAVGAPFKGAWPMAVDNNIKNFPVLGPIVEKGLGDFVINLVNRNRENKLDKTSIVYAELTPGSDFLNNLNSMKIPSVEVYALYGDVNATMRQKVFGKSFEKKVEFGDGLILPQSASYTDWAQTSKKYAFNDKILMDMKFNRQGSALAVEFQLSDPSMVRTLHADLVTNESSKTKIKCILISESAGGC